MIYLLLLSSLIIHQFTVCLTDLTLQHHASIFAPFPPLLFSTLLTSCDLLTLSSCFLLVFISVALSFLFSCLSRHPLSLLPTKMPVLIPAPPCFMLALLFMLVTSFMPLLTSHLSLPSCLLVSLYSCFYSSHTCHFIFHLCSHLPIKLLRYSVGSLYSCSGASDYFDSCSSFYYCVCCSFMCTHSSCSLFVHACHIFSTFILVK